MLVALFRLLSRFPLPFMHAAGKAMGWLVYGLSPTYRKRLNENMERAGYSSCRNEAVAEIGKSVLELPHVWYAPPQKVMARVEVENWSLVQSLLDENKGAIFLTPHLGAFEMTARWYALRAPITVIFREPHKALLRPLVRRVREVGGMRAVPSSLSVVRALLRALRAREAVGLLPDHVPGAGEGQWAPFFGEPAWTMTLPQQLVRSTGAAVVFAVGERVPGGWRIHLSRLDETPTPQLLNARIEALVRRWPAQYLWGYNRYKRPAGADRERRAMPARGKD